MIMATQVHHMNTVNINQSDIREFLEDLRRMKVRHRPFRKLGNYYEVDIYSDSKAMFLKLKYTVDNPAKDAIL